MTAKQAAFVREYLVDLNAARAARRAGYSAKSAAGIGWELLRKPAVAEAVAAAMAERSRRTGITQDRVLEQYARLAFFDLRKLYDRNGVLKPPGDLDEETAAAVTGLETVEKTAKNGEISGTVRKVKLADRRAALADLGKHLGLFSGGPAEEPAAGREPSLTVVVHGNDDPSA